jgi:hypothetical protein
MATSPLFGWSEPDDTDLVKDGAAAIRTLGNAIDTSLGDLLGGTSGQVLSKNSNTNMDFTWVTSDDANAIQNAIVDAKGDLITATAADTPARLAVGTDGQTLVADSTASTGLKWATPATASSGFVFVNSTSFSNVASVSIDSVFTSTYDTYMIDLMNVYGGTSTDDLHFQYRYGSTTATTAYYGSWVYWRPVTDGITGSRWRNAAQHTLNDYIGDSANMTHGNIYISQAGVSGKPAIWGASGNTSSEGFEAFGGTFDGSSQVFDGFLLKSSSSNITGTVRIYGLAKS